MKTVYFLSAVLLSLSACSGGVGKIAKDKAIGDWQVVTTQKGKDTGLCYAFTAPVASKGSFTGKRAAPYVMATRRTSGKVEISASSGYAYRPASVVEMVVEGASFKMKPKDSVAWSKNDAQDKALVAAIKKAGSLEVRGVTRDHKTTVDEYSAVGFAAALERVKELCP